MATSPSRRGAFNSLLSTTVTPIHTSTSRLLQVVLHSFQFDEIFLQDIVCLFDLGFRPLDKNVNVTQLMWAFNSLISTRVTPIHTSTMGCCKQFCSPFNLTKYLCQILFALLFHLGFRPVLLPTWRVVWPLIPCSALQLHQSTPPALGCKQFCTPFNLKKYSC